MTKAAPQWYNAYMYSCEKIAATLSREIDGALKKIDPDVVALLEAAKEEETNPRAAWALEQILENARIAACGDCYPCQDTGIAMLFVRMGCNAQFDGDLGDALVRGVRGGYRDARKSMVAHPLLRVNTKDNTPPVVRYEITAGNGLEVFFLAKGAGSENMSGLRMLTPSKGREGVIAAVTDIVREAGANPCPPVLLGVGIGGTTDLACELSKRALLRRAGAPSPVVCDAALERDILDAVNALGIGAQGLGGSHTALACAVETYPAHIGMLPVAVTVQCHSARHAHITFTEDE